MKQVRIEKELDSYSGSGKLMPNYGWVQNTSNLSTVRETVDLLTNESICHNELMKRILAYRLSVNNLGKKGKWTWDARCRIKAACACGMVRLDRDINGYVLTELGRKLQQSKKSERFYKNHRILSNEEKELFRAGLLTNPPVIRVLTILNQNRRQGASGCSKYDIGSQLGFVGDIGFTHIEPEYVVKHGLSFNDAEGDADKWARTILSWLTQVDWVVKSGKRMYLDKGLACYTTVRDVDNILRYSAKSSIKYIPSEMLCSDHHPFTKQVQYRRAIILSILADQRVYHIDNICEELDKHNIQCDRNTVEFDLLNLSQAGIQISKELYNYRLTDKIELDIREDRESIHIINKKEEIEEYIEKQILRYKDSIPMKLVENLIRYSNDGKNSAALFESYVAKFFAFLGYNTDYLGQGHGRVADVIAKYVDKSYPKSYAVIIDAKAYSKYSFPAGDVRKMKEYIALHGSELLQEKIPNHAFAFISNSFSNTQERLKEIADDTAVNGCAIEIDKLLAVGDKIVRKELQIPSMFNNFTNNSLFNI